MTFWDYKPDIIARVENRLFTRDMNMLRDLVEHVGFGEVFGDDCYRLRTTAGGKAYYGARNIERLVDLGFIEEQEQGHWLTIEGMEAVNFSEESRLRVARE